jgi:phage FluMu protein Com
VKPAKSKVPTLADCTAPIPLRCMHCDRLLPKFSKLETFGGYVVVECPKCRLATPFKLEKAS